jgi:hypothetical protein
MPSRSAVEDRGIYGSECCRSEKDPASGPVAGWRTAPSFLGTPNRLSRTFCGTMWNAAIPQAVVLNLEHWRLCDVERLHQDFPKYPLCARTAFLMKRCGWLRSTQELRCLPGGRYQQCSDVRSAPHWHVGQRAA